MGGRDVTEAILAASHVGKAFNGHHVLNDISASLTAGSVVGVLGKNGAGKTTLLEIALGFSPASSGSIQLWGHDSVALPSSLKGRIGYVPQQDELIQLLTGAQQLALTASLYRNWDHQLIARLAREWEVPLDRRISALSGGERQKISMLLALGHRPDLLVLDEPLASLDPIARRSFLRQLLEITADQTHTVIFSSHIVSDLERVANQVWILREGRMAWEGELDSIKESVVRLHLRARQPLPERIGMPHTLHEQVDGNTATISVSRWEPAQANSLATLLHAEVEVEPLDLEDIFLEMHR
jgi:ABC-2 type transport system ATP-binding protein